MFTKKMHLITIVLCCFLLMTACNMPTPGSDPDSDAIESTMAAQTVVARLTEIAVQPTAQPTQTQVPTQPQPTATLAPTSIPATNTPAPTKTTAPTATSVPCNWAQFIQDMTVSDGSQFTTGEEFTKVWRIKNIGSCTWNKDYDVAFDGGDKLSGSTVSLPKKVSPGQTVDIAIPMQAPNSKGSYKGYWLLRDDDGREFGIGWGASSPFWVEIKVVTSPDYQYNFAANFCDASWRSDNGKLYCQGTSANASYVQFTKDLVMENNKQENEAAIIVNAGKEDRVRGTYPAYTVQAGDHFKTRIGCVEDSDCNVKIQLWYRIKGTDTDVQLGQWIEKNDGDNTLVDIDLSSLDGEEVIFILDVSSRGNSSSDNRMFWFLPTIQN